MRILENRLGRDIPIRTQKDFPIEGVEFIDLMPAVMDKEAFHAIIIHLVEKIKDTGVEINYIISPEARGFIYGIPVARKLRTSFVPCRKFGKLPDKMVASSFAYNKEYGLDKLELPIIEENVEGFGYKGKNFFLVDDIYATGNTINAIKEAITNLGGNVIGTGVVLNIRELNHDKDVYAILDVDED